MKMDMNQVSNLQNDQASLAPSRSKMSIWLDILMISLKLGLTSFGGPTAHLAYFHHEYVQRKKWLGERSYADLVALCQFLPGPASSQVGMGIGIVRGGLVGGVLAWLGFTLPSVVALVCFALLMQQGSMGNVGWLHGLKLVAVAIVAQAVLTMGQKLAAGKVKVTLAILSAAAVLLWPTALSQMIVIIVAGVVGLFLFKQRDPETAINLTISISRRLAISCLLLFAALLLLLPIVSNATGWAWLSLFDSFYRVGSLVFGGGHVVLPLLQGEVVASDTIGGISDDIFLAGYGAVQAVPGPLFTISSYLGWFAQGWFGVFIATVAIFLPSFLLVVGALPFWSMLRSKPYAQAILAGINAAVVGILLAALYDPIWSTVVLRVEDFIVAVGLFVMLHFWRLPSWIIVVIGATIGYFIV